MCGRCRLLSRAELFYNSCRWWLALLTYKRVIETKSSLHSLDGETGETRRMISALRFTAILLVANTCITTVTWYSSKAVNSQPKRDISPVRLLSVDIFQPDHNTIHVLFYTRNNRYSNLNQYSIKLLRKICCVIGNNSFVLRRIFEVSTRKFRAKSLISLSAWTMLWY